jgi:hypothetical protein
MIGPPGTKPKQPALPAGNSPTTIFTSRSTRDAAWIARPKNQKSSRRHVPLNRLRPGATTDNDSFASKSASSKRLSKARQFSPPKRSTPRVCDSYSTFRPNPFPPGYVFWPLFDTVNVLTPLFDRLISRFGILSPSTFIRRSSSRFRALCSLIAVHAKASTKHTTTAGPCHSLLSMDFSESVSGLPLPCHQKQPRLSHPF